METTGKLDRPTDRLADKQTVTQATELFSASLVHFDKHSMDFFFFFFFFFFFCFFFYFFFYWRYNQLWVLAFSVILLHSILSLPSFLHPLFPSTRYLLKYLQSIFSLVFL
jgi:hypothetical protein